MFYIPFSFQKIISGIPSECQTTWIRIRPEVMYVGLDLGPNCLKNCSADEHSGDINGVDQIIHSLSLVI